MARHILKGLIVKHGANVFDGVREISIEETVPDVDLTAAGDTWQSHATGIPGWSGSISFVLDHDPVANQTLRAGDVFQFEGYTEGDATGKTYYSGEASITSHELGGGYDSEGTREYSIKGNGALSVAVVA